MHSLRQTVVLVSLAASAALAVGSAPAFADEVPAARQAAILTRVLAYDRSLKARAGSSVAIAVLISSKSSADQRKGEQIYKAFKALEKKFTVQEVPMRVVSLAFKDAAALGGPIAKHGVDVLYLGPGLQNEVSSITSLSRRRHLLTLTGDPELVRKGVALGVALKNNRPRIMVNLSASKAEGASFPSTLLKIADVVR